MRYDVIIFDLDGTILDTLGDLLQSCNYVLEKYNLEKIVLEDVRKNIGWGIRHLIYEVSNHSKYTDQMFEDYKEYYSVHYNDFTKPYKGINEVIDYCIGKGIKIGVYTNKVEDIALSLCEEHFMNKFIFVYGQMENRVRKPDPSFLLNVIEEYGFDKSKVLYVGDSEVDVQTAKNASIDGLFLSYGYRPKEELLKYTDRVIDSASEIIDYIRG